MHPTTQTLITVLSIVIVSILALFALKRFYLKLKHNVSTGAEQTVWPLAHEFSDEKLQAFANAVTIDKLRRKNPAIDKTVRFLYLKLYKNKLHPNDFFKAFSLTEIGDLAYIKINTTRRKTREQAEYILRRFRDTRNQQSKS